jgi:hypothetical protein
MVHDASIGNSKTRCGTQTTDGGLAKHPNVREKGLQESDARIRGGIYPMTNRGGFNGKGRPENNLREGHGCRGSRQHVTRDWLVRFRNNTIIKALLVSRPAKIIIQIIFPNARLNCGRRSRQLRRYIVGARGTATSQLVILT